MAELNEQNSSDDVVLFAETNYRDYRRKFGIKTVDRRQHMYFIGKTGTGKSTVFENMIYQDIQDGKGLAVVDPHGELAEKVLDFVKQQGGRVTQLDIRKKFPSSEAKISLILTDLEEQGKIRKIKKGRGNIIIAK